MPLRDLFSFHSRESQQFVNWPPAPPLRPIRTKTEGMLSILADSIEQQPESDYLPALIIAIGKTGEYTLALLSEKIFQSSASGSAGLRALLITESSPTLIQAVGRQIRVLELQEPGTLFIPRGTSHALRSSPNVLFQQVINYKRYQEWLQENLLDLGNDVQVFFVGSLAESTIGVLGDAVQILRNYPKSMGKDALFSRVSAFLSLRSVLPSALPPDEVFAACREISRMTFAGPHRMNTSFGQMPITTSALLDYFFLIDGVLPKEFTEKQEINIAQLLADSLFSLLHPSARFLWENLINDLRLSGQIRQESHQPVIHSIGDATLYIPLTEIKRYISARLAYAVLLGEQDDIAEGLAKLAVPQPDQARSLARNFLLNGPFTHPLFTWVLAANNPRYFDTVPDLSGDFISLFQTQLAHSLTQYLNQIPVDLAQAQLTLYWLDEHFSNCENWFKASKPPRPNSPERFAFQHLLFKWRESTQALIADLANWKKILFPPLVPKSSAASTPVPSSDWRNAKPTSSDWRQLDGAKKNEPPANIPAILKKWRTDSEFVLSATSMDRIYRSALADSSGGLKELETYYADTVRPELSQIGSGLGTSFTRIRQRLEWWIKLTPDRLPQLFLLCWPANLIASPEPPPNICFRADQMQEFSTALAQLCLSQTESLEADLTTNWFGRRIKHLADFLRRAGDAYIDYDHNVEKKYPNAASRRSYLISYDPTLSRDLVMDIFPTTPRFDINELSGGQKTRFTALTLRLNIPMSAVTKLQDLQKEYAEKLPDSIHLYEQERTAAIYEKRIWKLHRQRILISPELVVLLAEPQLVTLFFQALFAGIIHTEHTENGNQARWLVETVNDFPSLWLAPVQKDGLLLALRQFALEIPNAPDVSQNPQNHFYPGRRANYIFSLISLVKERAFKPETLVIRDSFSTELADWETRGEQDELAKSFHTLLVCEFDEPVWADW